MTLPDEKSPGSSGNGSWGEPLDRALGRASDAPLRTGNRLTLLRNGPEAFDEWLEEIEGAEKWVHLELFQFEGDRTGRRFAAALARKAAGGRARARPVRLVGLLHGAARLLAGATPRGRGGARRQPPRR